MLDKVHPYLFPLHIVLLKVFSTNGSFFKTISDVSHAIHSLTRARAIIIIIKKILRFDIKAVVFICFRTIC